MYFESIDLIELTREVFEQFEEKAKERNIRLVLDASSHKAIAYADWQRITQVMTNLVSNALKHSNEDSTVTVRFDVTKKFITTSVIDHGEGIPAEHLSRIFERFYRVDKSRSREKGGTGLGLAIVKKAVERIGGRVGVESEVGKGSRFWVELKH